MSQDYTINSFQGDHAGQTDLLNMEKNHECHRSFFSGASAPSNAVAGHPWFDTTQNLPKIRNDANSAWIAILTGTIYQKLWIYRNDTDDGWAIDATVTDRVLALKGGSGLYNVNGGVNAGETWANLKAHTHTGASHNHDIGNHVHQTYKDNGSSSHGQGYDSSGSLVTIPAGVITASGTHQHMLVGDQDSDENRMGDNYSANPASGSTDNETPGAGGGQSTADVRPAAAVGTLQYPDI